MGLIRNGAIERQLREFLSAHGYLGSSAHFQVLELAAIEPPGWVQTFRFELDVSREDGERVSLIGRCLDDDRHSRFEVSINQVPLDSSRPFAETDATIGNEQPPQPQPSRTGILVYAAAALVIASIGLVLRQLAAAMS